MNEKFFPFNKPIMMRQKLNTKESKNNKYLYYSQIHNRFSMSDVYLFNVHLFTLHYIYVYSIHIYCMYDINCKNWKIDYFLGMETPLYLAAYYRLYDCAKIS